jgi:ADP-ribose pyrophosphatase
VDENRSMSRISLRPWKTLSKRVVYKQGKFLTVESHTIELPGGEVITDWPWVIAPDAVNVIAQTVEGKFICFRQTKYAVNGVTLAAVGGMLEPGEEPLVAARRELREETGYEASDWVSLGSYVLEPNRGVNTVYLFLARQARQVAQADADDLEDQQILFLDRAELRSVLLAGEFKTVMWTSAVAMALLYLEEEP